MINAIKLEGIVCGNPPKFSKFSTGKMCLRFSIEWKAQGYAGIGYFNVVLWGKLAEEYNGKVAVGDRVIGEGQMRSWRTTTPPIRTIVDAVFRKIELFKLTQEPPEPEPNVAVDDNFYVPE